MPRSRVTGNGVGVIRARIIRADGTVEDVGVLSTTQVRWWQLRKRRVLRAMTRTEY